MKKGKGTVYGIIVFLALVVAVLVWNNYRVEVTQRPLKPIKLPGVLTGKCGIENCHGLDIVCGSDVPEMCTLEYQVGDLCRQFARCETISGKCQLVKEAKFEDCKSCVEKCQENFPNSDDQIEFSQCESDCGEKTD